MTQKKKITRRRILKTTGIAAAGTTLAAPTAASGVPVQGSTRDGNEEFDPNDSDEVDEYVERLEEMHENSTTRGERDPLGDLNEEQKQAVADRIAIDSVDVERIDDSDGFSIQSTGSVSRSVTATATAGNDIFTFYHSAEWEYDGDEILDYYNEHDHDTHMAFWSYEGLSTDTDASLGDDRILNRVGEFEACVLTYGCLQTMTAGVRYELSPTGGASISYTQPDPIDIPWT